MCHLHRPELFNRRTCMLLACVLTFASGSVSATTLADIPVGSSSNVPTNLMLALSVEYPTGTVGAYTDRSGYKYSTSSPYLGYFDSAKCYDYYTDSANGTAYFKPVRSALGGGGCLDSTGVSHWSGNMLNWATMTALDEFRQSLTGGNRSVDTSNTTVLRRSNLNSQSTSGNFPDKQIGSNVNVAANSVMGDSSYNTLSTVYLRSYGRGWTFQISNNSNFSDTGKTDNIDNTVTTFNAQVQVCVSGMLERNCNSAHKTTDYPNAGVYNKPEGLIQQNYQRIRVGAAGYAFASGSRAANGAVRALLRDNGPDTYNGNGTRNYFPCSAANQNPNSEWDCVTGIFKANPVPDTNGLAPGGGNATASGAINYLNNFGYASGYENIDTIADLYWASLSYLMKVPLDASYTSGLTAQNSLDAGFPVYTGSAVTDPIQFSCQANAIVTIGDSHTWYDTRVPSSGGPTPHDTEQAALPVVNGADAAKYVTALGNLPLIEGVTPTKTMASLFGTNTSLGDKLEPNGSGMNATYNMAGLAYFAHTQDIRADLTGKQTVDTYMVDVLEPGPYDGTTGREIYNPAKFNATSGAAGPNVYWLAAKYGGFNDINGDGVPANFLTWHTNSTTAADLNLRPDNYFPGNRPDLIQSGLLQIFNKVSAMAQSAAGPGVAISRILTNVPADATVAPYYSPVSGFPIYSVSYTPGNWTGDVAGYVASATHPGSVTAVTGSATWSAQAKLDALVKATGTTSTKYGWDTGRRIITFDGTQATPFRYTGLSSAQQTTLSSALVNYLRGDQSLEGTRYRVRPHILGDIAHSEAVLVQNALSTRYSEATNPGYTAFASHVANRQPVVYVGANDGMLHAFAGDFSSATTANPVTGGGSELFAYVPSFLYSGPNDTPQIDGLAALANLNGVSANAYAHHFYVDQTPQVADVDFNYTATSPHVTPPNPSTASNANWRSILVGGLGKGGKGFYALDITSVPSAIDSVSSTSSAEQTLATGKVLWEFTDPDLGYSYGTPLIVKTRKYGWVVLVTSGYNNSTGNGHLYVLNAKTGALLETVNTPTSVGTASNPMGLAQTTAYTKDITDNTIEQVYAGDLLGNVWRFDFSGTGPYPEPTLLAELTAPNGSPQPVTTAPRVELDLANNSLGVRRWVFIGTGKALDVSDLADTQRQSMYALRDGNGNNPSVVGLPTTRSTTTLRQLSSLTAGISVADTDAGWYYDLTGTAGQGGGTERIVVNPDAAAGTNTVAWASMTPTSDPCSLAGNIYAVEFGSGQSMLVDSAGNTMASVTLTSAPTKIEVLQLPGSTQVSLLYSGSSGLPQTAAMRQGGSSFQLQRVNWREVLN